MYHTQLLMYVCMYNVRMYVRMHVCMCDSKVCMYDFLLWEVSEQMIAVTDRMIFLNTFHNI